MISHSRLRPQWLFAVPFAMLLGGCATHYSGEVNRDPYGFFFGAWHGFILPYSLVGSFLSWLLSLLGIELLANVQLVG